MHDYKERFKYFEYKKGFGLISATHDELPGQKFTMRTTADERMDRYRWLLLKYFYAPRHPIINEENWLHARIGIINELEELINNVPNVEIQIQEFETDILGKRDELATVQGQNIIVTFRGRNWGTAYDEILLVGSHYDSDNMETMSLNDNGSGVVAMLEVVRSLSDAIVNQRALLLNTVIFVAFDVQHFEQASLFLPFSYPLLK